MQVRIYAQDNALFGRREVISDLVHDAAVAAFGIPPERRFHRFLGASPDDVVRPADRTDAYTLVEVIMMTGRSVEAKKAFYAAVFAGFAEKLGTVADDVEIMIIETPPHDWAFRGIPGDEASSA